MSVDLALYNPWMAADTYVVDETGATDCSETLIAAVRNAPRPAYSRPSLYLPPGSALRLAATWLVDRRICIEGNGCVLWPDDGVDAVHILVDSLNDNGLVHPNAHAGDSVFRNILISPPNFSNVDAGTGFVVHAPGAAFYDCRVMHKAIGWDIYGPDSDGAPKYNSNYGRIVNCSVSGATDKGVYFHGSDSNQWVIVGARALGGVGFVDSAYLHNHWFGPSCEGTSGISFESSGGVNATTIVGLYIESGDPAPTIEAPAALLVGGNGIRYLGKTTTCDWIGYGSARVKFGFPTEKNNGAPYTTVAIPGANGAIEWQRRVLEAHGWRLEYIPAAGGKPHRWAIRSEHTADANTPLSWTADTEGSPNPTGQIFPGISAADGGTIATSESLTAFFQSMLLPSGSGLAVPGATMGPTNDSTACAIDAQEFSDFSEVISLGLLVNDRTQYPRAIKALDVTSGTTLQVTTINGNTRNLTVSAGELVELQCVSIGTGTDCDLVRVYW